MTKSMTMTMTMTVLWYWYVKQVHVVGDDDVSISRLQLQLRNAPQMGVKAATFFTTLYLVLLIHNTKVFTASGVLYP